MSCAVIAVVLFVEILEVVIAVKVIVAVAPIVAIAIEVVGVLVSPF